jgi:hypothetical protein
MARGQSYLPAALAGGGRKAVMNPRTRDVLSVIIGMAAAGFVCSISGGVGLGLRAALTGGVAAVVTLLLIVILPRAPRS